MKIYFNIPGKVQAKQRPRFTGKFVYTPKQTVEYENWIKTCFLDKYRGMQPFENPLKVKIIAYYEIPKSTSKKKEAEMLQENISPTKKPDADNIIKIVLDAMNKFAFNDDTQVTKLEIEKKYDKAPRIYIRIEEY